MSKKSTEQMLAEIEKEIEQEMKNDETKNMTCPQCGGDDLALEWDTQKIVCYSCNAPTCDF